MYVSDVVKKLLSDPIPLKTLRPAIGGRFESFELYMFEKLRWFVKTQTDEILHKIRNQVSVFLSSTYFETSRKIRTMPANTRVDFTGLKQQHLDCDSQTNTLKETQIVIYSQIIF